MQDSGGDKNMNKFDLTKVALTKDNKGGTTATLHSQFRTMQPMRVVTIPSSSAGGAQIIQTQLVPQVQTMIKQVDNRITVSRPVTPTSYLPRGPTTVTNIQAPRGSTPIRGSTPPSSVTNITQSFVRTTGSPRAPNSSATATLIPQGTTWMSSTGVQVQVPTQLIRANITQSPRPRVVTQTIPQNSGNTINQQTGMQQGNQTVHGANVITAGNNQAFVATLALPPRQQGASLVYSQVSSSQPNQAFGQGQRLAVATSIGAQRQVRPLQRLPTTGIGVRVSTANLSIRQNVPVLATIPSAASTRTSTGTVSTNLAQIPARIIQPTGTAQVINARGVPGNVMTLQPIIGINRIPHVKTQIPQQLTIAHVSKIATASSGAGSMGTSTSNSPATITVTNLQQGSNQGQSGNLSQNQQLTASIVQGTVLNSQGQLQTQKSPQIAHILSVNQSNLQQGVQQHQIITSVQQSGNNSSGNVSTITSCGKTIPLVTVSVANLQGNVIRGIPTRNCEPPVAKVLPRQQSNIMETSGQQGSGQSGTSVFIHTNPPNVSAGQQQMSSNPSGVSVASGLPSGTFISPATKFIYEHIPNTSTVSSSTIIDSIFSLPKTSISKTTSTVVSSSNPIMTSQASVSSSGSGQNETHTSNSGATVISSNISYTPQSGSFAVVPTSNRTVGQIHVSSSNINQGQGQIQTVPVRFNPQLIVDSSGNAQSHGTQIIAVPNTMSSNNQLSGNNSNQIQNLSQQLNNQNQGQIITGINQSGNQTHIMIPASVSKVESPRPGVSPAASILRKRENEGSPIRITSKNLSTISVPSVSTQNSIVTQSSSGAGKLNQQQIQQHQQQLQQQMAQHLQQQQQQQDDRPHSPHSRPPSTDGSTTVSATSSPNLDQQEQEEMNSMMYGNHLNDIFGGPSRSGMHIGVSHQNSTESSSNGPMDVTPRKKPKKSLPNENINTSNMYMMHPNQNSNNKLINNTSVKSNNEVTVKKPQAVSLLQCYKQTWKAANNHFQRYSDVRPRDERRPSVMDLANQAHVLQKVNGWKIYHLSSQVEELCELESSVYDKLASQLESMEAHNSSPDVDRVSELLKGNMQREKIIIDGINDARTQLMKVFDHKSHVADIIHRCASKRNFKKREKP